MPASDPASSFSGNFQWMIITFSFDILLDKKLKPWLLEVNHAPSFNDDTEVDKIVKTSLITDTLRLLDVRMSNKQKILNNEKKNVMYRKPTTNQVD